MIQQIDREGNLIDEFSNASEAAVALRIDSSNIAKVLRGVRKYAGGYFWKEANSNVNETDLVGDLNPAFIPELDLHLQERGN